MHHAVWSQHAHLKHPKFNIFIQMEGKWRNPVWSQDKSNSFKAVFKFSSLHCHLMTVNRRVLKALWMFYLARAVNADHPCVASKWGQVSDQANMRACCLAASSDIHLMTSFGKIYFTWESSWLYSLMLRMGTSFSIPYKKIFCAF